MKILLIILLFSNYSMAQVEPGAGKWKTFVISSVKEYRLPPPDKTKTATEIKEIQTLQVNSNQEAINKILFWSAGAPGYRWNQLITKLTPPGGIPAFRQTAILNVAIYDATIAAWDNKYFYNRERPSGSFKKNIAAPDNPSYPCEYSVAAGVSAAILGYLYPARADSFNLLAEEACASRILSGVQYPSDVKEGFALGKKIALKVIERAKADGSDAKWTGKIPATPGLWNGPNPVGVTTSQLKPWIIDSASQFRPGPPPDFAKDMAELKEFKKTDLTNARAFYYATKDEWTEVTHQKIFEYNLQGNAPRAARVYALKSIAFNDAVISCWDAKYFYWGIRPYQYDSTFRPTLMTPPFPGYPSGHATTSNSMATVLAYLFPGDAESFYKLARECAESRFEGGIHFRTDNEVGLVMGHKIGQKIISAAVKDGAQENAASARKR